MARALIMAKLVCLAMLSTTSSAWALGPSAPFLPPAMAASGTGTGAPLVTEGVAFGVGGLTGIKRGRSPSALIDGRWVTQGDMVRDGVVLVAIERHAVQLKHADGTVERLVLSPGVEMTRSPRNTPTSTRMP
ncbi:hypothetical protein [Aquabacterium sp.]|uniref:hypothetical protein n=1 Tax=Aquabacterium sp. TaxID=1872578 RepID=UPI0024884D6B|nr:hypothetical protein [Aquabacterium sp.]MDI1259089.1 hypothetical protein [Aquabacterium sp.]